MANLYPVGAQELSVAEDATAFVIDGILLELSDVLPGDELCTSGSSAPIATVDDGAGHALAIPWPGPTISSSTSWWIRRVSDQRYSGFFMAQQAAVASARLAKIMAQGVQWACLSELNTPPGSPEEGDRHLIGPAPTGAWAANAGNVVDYLNGGWVYTVPRVGDVASIVTPGSFKLWNGSAWLGFSLSGGNLTSALNWAAAVDVASAATTDIGAAASNLVRITGTTTITSLGTVAAGASRWVRFAGALTLTHNGTSLILPGGATIMTAAGDTMLAVSEGSGNWRVHHYQPAAGYVGRKGAQTLEGDVTVVRSNAAGAVSVDIQNNSAGAPPAARLRLLTGTANSSLLLQLNDSGGAPFVFEQSGAAVTGKYMDHALHVWRSALGVEWARLSGHLGLNTTSPNKTGFSKAMTVNATGAANYAGAELASDDMWRAIWFANNVQMGFRSNLIKLQFDFGTSDMLTFHTNGLVSTLPITTAAYTVATSPNAAYFVGAIILVVDDVGGSIIAFSDGASWRRLTDRNVIS